MLWWWAMACVQVVTVQSEWRAYVQDLPNCRTNDDCVVITPGCPIGCAVAVPAVSVDDAEEFAAELVDRYQNVFRPCVYECGPVPPATCNLGTPYGKTITDPVGGPPRCVLDE